MPSRTAWLGRIDHQARGVIISTESLPTPSNPPDIAVAPVILGGQAPADSRQKAAATVRRRKEQRRAQSLREIQAQTADGSLIVRYMTPAQMAAASEVGRQTLARNEARGKRYKSPGARAPDGAPEA